MTVSYQYEVASSTSGGFIRLLFRWRGSVWKLVYREMLFFTGVYIILTVLYRFVLTEIQKRIFERIVFFCSTFMDLIPLSFVLGFYVSFTATRWWNQYIAIPWPDKLMNTIALYVPGTDDTSRVLRRTMMRYLNLTLVLVLRSISMAVKRRFPTKDHLIDAGFMTKLELEMLQSVPSTEFNTFWIPCTWFINLLRDARRECRITDSMGLKLIMEEFNEFRSKCGLLWGYDWISVPLVYTQVVTLATYAFFVACIFGRQYVENTENGASGHKFEYYVPVFTIFQLFFYMGLLKVAEQLINPFGDDDEDFELNWIIDRHIKVSYLGVDTLNAPPPPLMKDNYFYEQDMKLPYTEASMVYKKKTYRGSVARMQVPQEKQGLLVPDFSEDEDDLADEFGMGNRRASTWTIVGGKISDRFSVSAMNLDTDSLGSAYSMYIGPNSGQMVNPQPDGKNASGTWGTSLLGIPEEGTTVPGDVSEQGSTITGQQVNYRPKHKDSVISTQDMAHPVIIRSGTPRKPIIKKIVKSVARPVRTVNLLRKAAHHHPPQVQRWRAFEIDPRHRTGEVLSLFRPADLVEGNQVSDNIPVPISHKRASDTSGGTPSVLTATEHSVTFAPTKSNEPEYIALATSPTQQQAEPTKPIEEQALIYVDEYPADIEADYIATDVLVPAVEYGYQGVPIATLAEYPDDIGSADNDQEMYIYEEEPYKEVTIIRSASEGIITDLSGDLAVAQDHRFITSELPMSEDDPSYVPHFVLTRASPSRESFHGPKT